MKKLVLLPAVFAVFILACSSGQSPYSSTADAKILPDKSFRSLDAGGDSVKVNTVQQCTVQVYLPNLIDSFYVHQIQVGSDSTIASGTVSEQYITFPFSAKTGGEYSLVVVIVKSDKTVDSLAKTVTVYTMAPVVTPDSAVIHVFFPVDSVVVSFTVTDPDSNVWKAYTWLDSATVLMEETSFAPKTNRSVITRTLRRPALLAALKTPLVCYAAAIDFPDSNVSRTAACTLVVKDTVAPRIHLLLPADTINPIPSPVTVKALVTDAVGVDSVKFDTSAMVLTGDTALFAASYLDSGRHIDSIIAVDKTGNKSKLLFSINVQGKTFIPPQIKDLSRATPQGRPFAPIPLDSFVILADTSIHDKLGYAKDSLAWIVIDSIGVSQPVQPGHLFTVPFPPDSMWQGTIKLTFKLFNGAMSTLYDTKQPSFFVTPFNYPPIITLSSYRCFKNFKTDTIYLDTITTAHDPNDKLSTLNWTFTRGRHFKVDSLYSSIFIIRQPKQLADPLGPGIVIQPTYFNRHIVIDTVSAADATFFGVDTLTFTVTDPSGASVSKPIFYTHTSGFCLY